MSAPRNTPDHRCDTGCTCPLHGTPLWFAPASGDHACQDPDCVLAHGVKFLRCNWAMTRHHHAAHPWPPQPSMDPVLCQGFPPPQEAPCPGR